jgi:O-antigen/teichoic acid export membrane protein
VEAASFRIADVTEPTPADRRTSRLSGFSLIMIATAVSGVASYAVTWIVPHRVGLAGYAVFAVFWSFLYLVVGTLSGIQQEVTRATLPLGHEPSPRPHRARNLAIMAAGSVIAIVVGTAPLWVNAAFPAGGWALVWPLAFGAACYVFVAVLAGSLYGVSAWLPLALMIGLDAVLRLVAVSVALLFTRDVVVLAWAVALPFPGTLLVLWPVIRRSIVGTSQLDVGYRALVRHVSHTMLAAASTGVMVSGLPLLIGLTAPGVPKDVVGLYILSITLTRAPLIVVAMSLQGYFIITFRKNAERFWRTFLRIQALVLASGIVLAGVGWLVGPAVFAFLFPGQLRPEGWLIAVLVLSSALVGSLCVSAPAVLARSQHRVYTTGWVVGAVVTIVMLLVPLPFTTRIVLALVLAPIAALIVHGSYLVRAGRRERASIAA